MEGSLSTGPTPSSFRGESMTIFRGRTGKGLVRKRKCNWEVGLVSFPASVQGTSLSCKSAAYILSNLLVGLGRTQNFIKNIFL